MFKNITEQDVKDTLIKLIDEKGCTSALEVKKSLRKDGFWALQNEISELLGQVHREAGVIRTNNGSYFIYEYETLQTSDLDLDEDENEEDDVVSATVDAFTNFIDGLTSVPAIPKSKIISEPEMLSEDNYELTISHDGKNVRLVISDSPNLKNSGTLVYEVRGGNGYTWYLYSEDKDIITRHKAIYYVWKVISQEYDGFLAYADMRSTKLFR
jgi:hypothetical protein